MSVKIMGAVWDLDLPQNEQSLLLALADHADHAGNKVFPSNGLIAWKVGCSTDTVARIKNKLEEKGILILVSAEPGRVREYRIAIENGVKKKPFEPIKRFGNTIPTHPQVADTSKSNPSASCVSTPPQVASNPSAELCGANRITVKIEPSSSPHQEFISLWTTTYESKFSRKYFFDGGKDAIAVKRLLKGTNLSPVALVEIAKQAWEKSGRDYWSCEKADTIAGFVSQFNKIQTELERNGKTNGAVNPRNSGIAFDPAASGRRTAEFIARKQREMESSAST